MIIDGLSGLVQEVAPRYDLNWQDLAAILDVESSGGRNLAIRSEPNVRDFSIGPGQVLTATAVWMLNGGHIRHPDVRRQMQFATDLMSAQGVRPLWDAMERPSISIELAASYFAYQMRRYEQLKDEPTTWAVAAYNAGTARLTPEGQFRNQGYVDKWRTAREFYND